MAMAINKVIVIGNLGANPDGSCSAQLGAERGEFLAGDDRAFHGSERHEAGAHRMASVVAFGRLADTCQRFLSKGRQVYIEGRLTTRQYEAKDGSGKRYRTEIVARQLRMLGNRAEHAQG